MIQREPFVFSAIDATREAILLRAALAGKSKSGKSWTALLIACHLAARIGLGPVFAIDSENGSLLRYAKSPKTGKGFAFQHVKMPVDDYSPETYCRALDFCEGEGASVILIDGISQEWTDAPGCVLEQVDAITDAASAEKSRRAGDGRQAKAASAFSTGWAEMSPRHNMFVQRLLRCSAHLLVTMRCKTEYVIEASGRPREVGLQPIQRRGVEYEFDVFCQMEDAVLTVGGTRCDRITPGMVVKHPGADFAQLLVDWIEDVEAAPVKLQPELAGFAADQAAVGTAAARLELLQRMREKREPQPVQTAALRAFDEAMAKRGA
jgi:AAA domain-containing protein